MMSSGLTPRMMNHMGRICRRLSYLHSSTQNQCCCHTLLPTAASRTIKTQHYSKTLPEALGIAEIINHLRTHACELMTKRTSIYSFGGTSDWNLLKLNRTLRILQCMNQKAQSYSTSSQESLSLENPSVQEYLSSLKDRYEGAQSNMANMKLVRTLKPIMDILQEVEATQSDLRELSVLAEDCESDREMRDLARQDLQDARDTLLTLQDQLFDALVPEEAADNTNVVLEVSAGVGGQEAMLFCQEVFDMYQGYAEYMGWHTELTDYETTVIGGLRRGAAVISGESVYQAMKYEGGIHRVQRVPKTEKAGRIHTSTVSVAVMPEPSEIDIEILDKDLKIETKRASGAGGQHVNTTDSAVRIIHLPSGMCVESQEGRSQHQNKNTCLKKLRAQLYQQQLDQTMSSYTSNRKLQVGTRSRSEKIRTYNYPQDRVTDHRISSSLHNLPSFLTGTELLHSLICRVLEEAQKEALQEIISGRGEGRTVK